MSQAQQPITLSFRMPNGEAVSISAKQLLNSMRKAAGFLVIPIAGYCVGGWKGFAFATVVAIFK